jgi:hypothetical protein
VVIGGDWGGKSRNGSAVKKSSVIKDDDEVLYKRSLRSKRNYAGVEGN